MIQYIDRDTLVAELKKRIDDYWSDPENTMGIYPYVLEEIINYVSTLEVKEVDFEKEVDVEWDKCNPVDEGMGCEFATIGIEQFYFITKYFFELGLKAAQKKE